MQLRGQNLVPFTFDKQVLLLETMYAIWRCDHSLRIAARPRLQAKGSPPRLTHVLYWSAILPHGSQVRTDSAQKRVDLAEDCNNALLQLFELNKGS